MTTDQRISSIPVQRTGTSYDAERGAFTWKGARAQLTGLPGGRGLNIGYEAVDRHVDDGEGHQIALRFVSEDGSVHDVSYDRLRQLSNRFAEVLGDLAVHRGERVATLLDRQPELYIAALGTLKRGAVFCELPASLAPEPVRERLFAGEVTVLVTTPATYRQSVEGIREDLPTLRHVLVVGGSAGPATLDLAAALDTASPDYPVAATAPEDPALLQFTSGRGGPPLGSLHVHEAVVAHFATGRWALDLHRGDVFWCTGNIGRSTDVSYGIVAPLTCGATIIVYAGEFDAPRWYQVLAGQRVNVWCTGPAELLRLMRRGADLPHAYDLSALRHLASVGDVLGPELVVWGVEAVGLPVHDNWSQTETGAVMISNHRGMAIRPGSVGRPIPGIEAAVLMRGPDNRVLIKGGLVQPAGVNEVGELALRQGWPSMFRGYLGDKNRYERRFTDGWYLTGELGRVDPDGYVWFVGRAAEPGIG